MADLVFNLFILISAITAIYTPIFLFAVYDGYVGDSSVRYRLVEVAEGIWKNPGIFACISIVTAYIFVMDFVQGEWRHG